MIKLINIIAKIKDMYKKIFLFLLIVVSAVVFFFMTSCTQQTEYVKDDTINIMVSILPQVDFVERIGGDKVNVSEMIPPGFSPATYDPSPSQLKKLQDADIYFRIGHIAFEKVQIGRLKDVNPRMEVVDTSVGVGLLTLADHHHEAGDENEHEDEGEEGGDPHIWLSPKLVKIQAEHIYNTLVKYSPENEEYFTVNYNQLLTDLDALDTKLAVAFAPIKEQVILVFHPAFGYLADAYNFRQEAIEIEGKDPSPAQLQKIIDESRARSAKAIFVQSQFSTKSAEAVAREIGGVVVQIDPLAEDYFFNLENMAEIIVDSFE